MGVKAIFVGKSRKRQLLVPIAAMTLGALVLLVVLVVFLVNRFLVRHYRKFLFLDWMSDSNIIHSIC